MQIILIIGSRSADRSRDNRPAACLRERLAPSRDAAVPLPFSLHSRSSDPDLIPSRPAVNSRTNPLSPVPARSWNPSLDFQNKVRDVASPAYTTATAAPPSPASSTSHDPGRNDAEHATTTSTLHPRVAVILGVDRKWYLPLIICRALSTVPSAWWGLRCAFTFLAELLQIRPGMGREGWTAAIVGSAGQEWDVERRFRVTEVALAIMWCCASAYLSYFFADCMMSRWLLNYTPPAVVIRLLTTNGLIAYISSWVLYLSGASSDPRLLLPAWISITTTLTFVYHATQNHATIKRETTASLLVFSVASFVSTSLLLLQLHLTRENEPEVPVFVITRKLWSWAVAIFLRMRVADERAMGEL
ncbi:N-glycosylation protein-domain-containing protein [Aspergillus taichungensis]|uniref:N-glycosylation protein-domain-containing protein n=1 Tax=Aspergillus taichungensis TaxID=482145 RepID=A0A2J5I0J7_9EURO|nr:N-glycosylation protein-domain-containing protein [Aspergillus taichungensis]